MKETALMAVSLAVILALACYIQPAEEQLFMKRAKDAAGVTGKVPEPASLQTQDADSPAADGDEGERWDAC